MSDLRSRRSQETAREIQVATIELIEEVGFDKVTTESIAEHLQISKRTFFNYFPNKEAALLGPTPTFPPEAIERFKRSDEEPALALRDLMREHTLSIEPRRRELSVVITTLQDHPKVLQLWVGHREAIRENLSRLIEQKYPALGPQSHYMLSELMLICGWSSLDTWIRKRTKLAKAFDQNWQSLIAATELILPSKK